MGRSQKTYIDSISASRPSYPPKRTAMILNVKNGYIDFTKSTYVNDELSVPFRLARWPKTPFKSTSFASSILCSNCIEMNKLRPHHTAPFPCILSTDSQFTSCALCIMNGEKDGCLTKVQRELAIRKYESTSKSSTASSSIMTPTPVNGSEEKKRAQDEEEPTREEQAAEICHPKVNNKRKRQNESIEKGRKASFPDQFVLCDVQGQDDRGKRQKLGTEGINEAAECEAAECDKDLQADLPSTEDLIKIKLEHAEIESEASESVEPIQDAGQTEQQSCPKPIDNTEDKNEPTKFDIPPLSDRTCLREVLASYAIKVYDLEKRLERSEEERQKLENQFHSTLHEFQLAKTNIKNANSAFATPTNHVPEMISDPIPTRQKSPKVRFVDGS
ncbi:uncharacterized protein FA14DRAFT_186197 [Meira miltonrushii]|uniref:Uncharacterized protein n=1 Tax=Meira miltonrushii TaxID=1280837 RepID=A0A316V261_9BASI|nr:uncharacterized protein FA14DRAFT_186197 [Meira miltonrushii]PWN31636.1 hypothetical protein FA14DRAFT_186197 [Meira miltonrushii]